MKWTFQENVHIACVKSKQTTLPEWECHSSTTRKQWSQICLQAKYKSLFIFLPLHTFCKQPIAMMLNKTSRKLYYPSPFLLCIVTAGITRLSVSIGWFSCPCCSCRKGFSNTPANTQVHICPSMCWEEIQQAPKGWLAFLYVIQNQI